MYPFETTWGGSEESIKGSFAKKYKRYGQLDKPYIVCINAIGMKGNGDIDVENALWGSVAWTWSTDPNNRNERWERQLVNDRAQQERDPLPRDQPSPCPLFGLLDAKTETVFEVA